MFRRPPSTEPKWRLILVSHTHWDREWYLPFQRFRAMLVEAVDSLLEIMGSDPDYRYFTLDGQTIVLEDYLEVRPDRAAALRELIARGRILIGPWYVMPDEFLVDGEALIRNLLEGRRVGSAFGPIMRVGYIPDPFGHIAQMPQILLGFGMDSAVLWRGIGSELRHNEALWEAPDGSRVLLLHLVRGYSNADLLPSAPDALMERLSQIRAALEPGATTLHLLLMNGDDHRFPQSEIPLIVAEANRRAPDAEVVHGTLPMMIQAVREATGGQAVDWEVVKGELRSSERAHILAGVLSSRMRLKQRNFRCQTLLERWAEPFSSFALLLAPDSADSPETSDPARAVAGLLRVAWRYLLMNQPHDSICGCSVDQVHQEMETRYDWCEQIASRVADRALARLATATDTESLLRRQQARGALVVFNSEAGPRTDWVEATVQLPAEPRESVLVEPDGSPVPYQLLRARPAELAGGTLRRSELQGYLRLAGPGRDWPRWKLRIMEKMVRATLRGRLPDLVVTTMDVLPGTDPSTVEVTVEMAAGRGHDYDAIAAGLRQLSSLVDRGNAQFFRFRVHRRDQADIVLVARDVPAHGFKLFHFAAGNAPATPLHDHQETTLKNEFLSLQISSEDGSIQLIDRATGTIYSGLNSFVDGGDAGDEYTYSPPAQDLLIQGPLAPPTITWEETGPARQRIRVEGTLRLPVGLAEDRGARSGETVDCPLTTWLSLYPGVPRLDIRTSFVNRARDHRLRVHFPTQLQAPCSYAEDHFAVARRSIEAPEGGVDWVEHPVSSQPQWAFVDLNDGESGLLVANRGLPEYDVAGLEQGPCIALTLLRCVGWLSRGDLATRRGDAGPSLPTPGAQMLGDHTFEYSVIPHAGGWAEALQHAHWFARPLRAAWTDTHPGRLGTEASFISISPAHLVLSAVKQAEDGEGDLIVRLYNVTERATEGTLHSHLPLVAAGVCNLAEEAGEDLPIADGRIVRFSAGAHQIVTLRITPAR